MRFSLSSQQVFSRTESDFESAAFYNSIINFLQENEDHQDVRDLLLFWNQYVVMSVQLNHFVPKAYWEQTDIPTLLGRQVTYHGQQCIGVPSTANGAE